MAAIVDFFISIGDLIGSIITFGIIQPVRDTLYVFGLLNDVLANLPSLIGWLPTACFSMAKAVFGLVVAFKIIKVVV